MSYQAMFSFAFVNLPGLTLNAKLFDSSGAQTGATIITGFSDLGDGAYQYLATIPDGHVGTLKIYDSAQPSRCISLAVNPQEIENADVKTSTRSTFAGGAVASVTGNVGGNVVGSVGSLAMQAKADVNAEADTALADAGVTTTVTGRIDAAITTRATPANVTSAQTAITTAIGALNNLSATDAAAAIMAYVVSGGRDFQTILLDLWAKEAGNAIANDATNPTHAEYANPNGDVQIAHDMTATTRTVV